MKESDAIERTPGKLGGTPVFPGTRVPISALLDNLEAGHTIHEFGMDNAVPKKLFGKQAGRRERAAFGAVMPRWRGA